MAIDINISNEIVEINETSQVVEIAASSGIITYDPVNLVTNVRNQTGSSIDKLKVVYISGATGNKPLISLASNTTSITAIDTYGVTRDVIANNGTGYVVTVGELRDVNTQAFNEGDELWLGTNGNVITTQPAEPAFAVFIGFVVRSHPTMGVIDVRIQNGYLLDELHGVQITNPINNQVLKYNSATGLWVNSSDTDTGITTLNTLTATTQTFATGTSGTDFNISSASSTHTFNLPTASATNRGLLSSADWSTFNSKGTVTSVALATGTSGTDVNVSGSPITSSGTITLNIPDASATARGLITTLSQVIAGTKFLTHNLTLTGNANTYAAKIFLDGYVVSGSRIGAGISFRSGDNNQSVPVGTYVTLLSNNADKLNIYFSGTTKVANLLGNSLTAERDYTLPNASGTLALTSDLTGGTVTSVALATGTTGTDVNVSGSPITSSGTITLNIPNASASARGLVNTTLQTFAGNKTFNGGIVVSGDGGGARGIDVNGASNVAGYIGIKSGVSGYTYQTTGYISLTSSQADYLTVSFQSATKVANFIGSSLSANRNYTLPDASGTLALTSQLNSGTVTSVGLTSSTTGITITGSPVTTSGNLNFEIATASGSATGLLSSTDWTTFNNKQNALTFGNLSETGSSILTISGGTGAVIGSGTTIQVAQASGSTSGFLSSTDWTTFNNKQNALTNPVTGTGTSGQVAYFTGATTQAGSSTFLFSPTSELDLANSVTAATAIARGARFRPTLVAAANNDVLVGLDVNPTFTIGAFTGVTRAALRVYAHSTTILETRTEGLQIASSQVGHAPAIILNGTAASARTFRLASWQDGTTGRFVIRDDGAGSDRFAIFSNGNVAINSTTDAGFRLDINGTARVQGTLTGTGIISAATEFRLNNQSFSRVAIMDAGGSFAGGYNLTFSGSTPVHDSTGAISGYYYSSGGTIRFYTNSSQTAGTTATERMRLDASGNLGIGTASPTAVTAGRRTQVIRGTSAELILQSSNATDGTSVGITYTAAGNDAYFVNRLDGFYAWITGGAGNTERMRLDANGNLGLGTPSPAVKLELAGTGTQQVRITSTSGADMRINADTVGRVGTYSNSNLAVIVNSTGVATFDTSGNLGLGVTPSAWSTFNSVKAIELATGALWNFNTVSNLYLSSNVYLNSSSQRIYKSTGAASEYAQISGAHQWYTAASGTAGNAITFTQAMTLDASGNLGLGQTSISAVGSQRIFQIGTTGGGTVSHYDGASLAYRTSASLTGVDLYNPNATPIIFYTSGSDRMRIFSDGNVGIGTGSTNAGFKLDVNGTARVSGAATFNSSITATASGGASPIMSKDTSTTGSFLRILGDTGSQNLINWQTGTALRFATSTEAYGTFVERMRLDASGNLLVGGTSAYAATITSYGSSTRSGGIGIRNSAGTAAGSFGTYAAGSGTGSTDMYIDATGFLGFGLGGSERHRFFSNGRIGLNTITDAGFTLDVNGTARVQGASTITTNVDAASGLDVINQNTGTSARSRIKLGSANSNWYFDAVRIGGRLSLSNDISGTVTELFQIANTGAATFSSSVTAASFTVNDAGNIAVGTTTGTKIGTATSQKISLWNATPDVQPTTAITAAAFVANTSGIVDDTATFGGYTIGQIVAALKRIGALA